MSEADRLGERLKEAREAAGLTQAEAAQRAGVHEVSLSRWERGVRRLGAAEAQRLAAIYRVPLSTLLPGRASEDSQSVSHETAGGWVQGFLDEIRAGGATEDEISWARGLLTEANVGYRRDEQVELSEGEHTLLLEGLALGIRRVLRAKGRDVAMR